MRADRGMFVPRQPRSQFAPQWADAPQRRPPSPGLIERLTAIEERVDAMVTKIPPEDLPKE